MLFLSLSFSEILPSHRFSFVQDFHLCNTIDVSNLHNNIYKSDLFLLTVFVGSLQTNQTDPKKLTTYIEEPSKTFVQP